mgnify:CR=1 FL=1
MKHKFLISILALLLSSRILAQETGDSIINLEVNFELDAFTLSPAEKDKVDSLLSLVPFTVVKEVAIYGHTDSLASVEYNRSLSKRRVQSILAYLVYQGLDPLKVKADYYGEERPKYSNAPEERFRNRRCELYFIIDPSRLPPPEQKLTDLPFATGDKVRIPQLNFVGNQPIPMPESFSSLEDLLRVMEQYPDLRIELHGHVCCGNDHELSVERAKMVYAFLVGNGIDPARMSYEGFSNTQPLFPERTEKEKALNRRVEVYVVTNTDRIATVKKDPPAIDLRAPVLGVKFFPQKSRLYPSGDFMLTLVADMMRESEGLFYEFVLFDNINNARLTKSRVASIDRTLSSKKVDRSIYKVRSSTKTRGMPDADNLNLLMLKITEQP